MAVKLEFTLKTPTGETLEFITTKNNIKVIKISKILYYVKSKHKISRWYKIYYDNYSDMLICNCMNFGIHFGKKQRCYHLRAVDQIFYKEAGDDLLNS